jgi:hypothetical protein
MAKKDKVPVSAIARQRLQDWVQSCERDHATPLVLIAIGHDEQAGSLHVYCPEGVPSGVDLGALLRRVAAQMEMQAQG